MDILGVFIVELLYINVEESIMRKKSILWFANNKNIVNIAKFTLLSFALLILVWIVDIRYPIFKLDVPKLILLSAEVSSTFLSNLSGVFLTVTTFTFTTILTVITHYSGNYSPRVVQNFIDKPKVLSLFGIFVGGFFYSVLSLFMLQNVELDQPVLSGTIGVLYAIASMVYFVLFVRRVLRDIKSVNLINDIYEEALALVEEETNRREQSQRYDHDSFTNNIKVYADVTGYLYGVDYGRLMGYLKDIKCEFVIHKKIGEYIPKGMYIATLDYIEDEAMNRDESIEFLDNLSDTFILNKTKNDSQDYHNEITNLVEIALRAISPGINDPNTAINCISKISILLGTLFGNENNFIVAESNENAKIVYISYSVEEELYLTFYQLINYGKSDPSVAYAILEAIYLIYMISDEKAGDSIKEFFEQTYQICYTNMESEMDRQHLKSIHDEFVDTKEKPIDEDASKN